MSVKEYLKEKRLLFLFFFLASIFCVLVYWSNEKSMNSSMTYMLEGILGFFIIYVIIDFFILKSRAQRIKQYIRNGATENEIFIYPMDSNCATEVNKLAKDFNGYRTKIEEQYADELDFITKWVHDIKVPISALYLLIESIEDDIADNLMMQISYIEQHTQKVLFHIKSKSFHDDYKISKASTHAIISTALKHYATFFACKKISLNLLYDDYQVLTDEKWSGYIISQLLSNAVKHTPEYGEISIKTSLKNNRTIISIKNTGDGIKAKNLDLVFKKGYTYYQERGGSSTGYGLYLAKKLANRMGHELYAVSKVGEYTEFCVSFSKINGNIAKL